MQALHRKLDVVLVQILRYNCSETDYSFCEDSPPAGLRTLPGCGFHPQTPSAPPLFFFAPPPLLTSAHMCKQPIVVPTMVDVANAVSTVDDYHHLLITLNNQLLCTARWTIGRDGLAPSIGVS